MKARKKVDVQAYSIEPHSAPSYNYSWLTWSIPPVLLALFSYLFYYPSLYYSFQFDDIANIQKSYSIRHNDLSTLFLNGARWISYWLNALTYRLGKFDPFYYRFFNVTFHTLSGVLLFFLFYVLLSGLKKQSFFKDNAFSLSFLTALLFLLHPVQTQTVSYVIQGQLEGLATLFCIGMLLCFALLSKTKNIILYSVGCIFLLALAFFATGTKEIAIMIPALFLLVDWFFIAQGDWPALKNRLLLHITITLIIVAMYLYFLKPSFFKDVAALNIQASNNIGNILTETPTAKITPGHFFISQFKVLLHYMFMFIWPFNISVEYDWKLVHDFFSPDCILPFLVLLTLAFIIIRALKMNRTCVWAFGFLWFFIAMAPRSTIIPSSELLADYKTYLGSVGLVFLLACGVVKLIDSIKVPHYAFQYAALLLLAFPLGYLTRQRNTIWRSSEEFWTNIIENAPGKARAYNNLGVALSEKGRMQESIPLYKKAIAMDRFYPDPWNNLAVAYSMTNKLDLAVQTLQQAIQIHRYYPEAYNNLASFLITKKDYDAAEKVLQYALHLRPFYGKAYYNLAKIYVEKGQPEKAHQAFKDACTKADLDNASGYSVYGQMSMNLHKYQDAIFAYSKLLELQPTSIDTALLLANAYFYDHQFDNALDLFTKIVQSNPQEARAWYNMGESYLALKQTLKALECFLRVKKIGHAAPLLNIRIASCLIQLDKKSEAKIVLQDVVGQHDIPESLKNNARQLLTQLA